MTNDWPFSLCLNQHILRFRRPPLSGPTPISTSSFTPLLHLAFRHPHPVTRRSTTIRQQGPFTTIQRVLSSGISARNAGRFYSCSTTCSGFKRVLPSLSRDLFFMSVMLICCWTRASYPHCRFSNQMEISAVQRRRLEVHLVKVEQQLQGTSTRDRHQQSLPHFSYQYQSALVLCPVYARFVLSDFVLFRE